MPPHLIGRDRLRATYLGAAVRILAALLAELVVTLVKTLGEAGGKLLGNALSSHGVLGDNRLDKSLGVDVKITDLLARGFAEGVPLNIGFPASEIIDKNLALGIKRLPRCREVNSIIQGQVFGACDCRRTGLESLDELGGGILNGLVVTREALDGMVEVVNTLADHAENPFDGAELAPEDAGRGLSQV